MTELILKNQSVSELEYNFLVSSNLKSSFNIFKNKLITWQNINLDFSIIGSSHLVDICIDKSEEYTELLACLEVKNLKAKKRLNQKTLKELNDYKYYNKFNQSYTYNFNVEVIEDKIKDYQDFIDKYRNNKFDIFLNYIFPSLDGLAITDIEIKKDKDRFLWLTYHSYPQENRLVKTWSLIERSD